MFFVVFSFFAFAFLLVQQFVIPWLEMRLLFAQGLAWQEGGLGLPSALCALVYGFGCARYVLLLGWPCGENK